MEKNKKESKAPNSNSKKNDDKSNNMNTKSNQNNSGIDYSKKDVHIEDIFSKDGTLNLKGVKFPYPITQKVIENVERRTKEMARESDTPFAVPHYEVKYNTWSMKNRKVFSPDDPLDFTNPDLPHILRPTKFRRPIAYPEFEESRVLQRKMHWIKEEVDLSSDIKDWYCHMTELERSFFVNIFGLFTISDQVIGKNYMSLLANIFVRPEINGNICQIAAVEAEHAAAYEQLALSLGLTDSVLNEFFDYKEMKDKHDNLQCLSVSTIGGLVSTIVENSMKGEGISLFASFAPMFCFSLSQGLDDIKKLDSKSQAMTFGRLRGLSQIVTWSIKDENVHVQIMLHLLRIILEQTGLIKNKEFIAEIYYRIAVGIKIEDDFIDLLFKRVDKIGYTGLTKNVLKEYMRFLANIRLGECGLEPMFEVQADPIPELTFMLKNPEHTNFFENAVAEYTAGAGQKGNVDYERYGVQKPDRSYKTYE